MTDRRFTTPDDRQANKRSFRLSSVVRRVSGGYIVISVVIFGTVFLTILGGLVGFVFLQTKAQITKENRERALQIAEAGLDYYKWRLSHFPNDLTNGTGQAGPYTVPYSDPE